ncbi:YycH family regulatory protein [Allobacillus sp. GCM10007491]|uniref:Regulatory protein YycH domain-containing protein n=1 Tax=Allobacillus saliphilus TaxID=2912308 RepID=A0A941CY10_9BACI|nr:two-component system activity regulator YycH [Allobacillus saliphilus]MBR7554508.1 hypothetical protein [Allobacillus saliphilus]
MIENIKSVILFILVASSLLLTLALWNYQPAYEELGEPTYLDETRLKGDKRQIADVVYPKKILFHNFHEHSQLPDYRGMEQLYEKIKEWPFAEVEPFVSEDVSIWSRNMEVIFPEEIPLAYIVQLMNINDMENLWNQTFNQVYFQLSQNNKEIVRVTFASDEYDGYLNAEIHSTSVYNEIDELIHNENNIALGSYDMNEETTLYLPVERINLPGYTILTEEIYDIQPLINNLFSNPTMVRRQLPNGNSNEESYYTDGSRALTIKRVLQNEKAMEFVNPFSTDAPRMTNYDLMNRSIAFTNDYDGWTDTFYLDSLNEHRNEIAFRMYYDGLPIFDTEGHTMIRQTWRDNRIYQFERPLFFTSTNFQSEEMESVRSGLSVYQFLKQYSDTFSLNAISDMRIGYEVNTISDTSNAMYLKPSWFIKYKGDWQPMSYFENMLQTRGDE